MSPSLCSWLPFFFLAHPPDPIPPTWFSGWHTLTPHSPHFILLTSELCLRRSLSFEHSPDCPWGLRLISFNRFLNTRKVLDYFRRSNILYILHKLYLSECHVSICTALSDVLAASAGGGVCFSTPWRRGWRWCPWWCCTLQVTWPRCPACSLAWPSSAR